MLNRHKLFLDLDGVLADMDKKIIEISGKRPSEMSPGDFWKHVESHGSFFESLEWCPGGEALWERTKHLHPTILTGVPSKRYEFEQQKRRWVAQKLGLHVSVICCESKDKIHEAKLMCTRNEIPVLVDDWDKYEAEWTANGGVFIQHRKTHNTLKDLSRALIRGGESGFAPLAPGGFHYPEPPLDRVVIGFKLNTWARGTTWLNVWLETIGDEKYRVYRVDTEKGDDLTYLFEGGPLEENLRQHLEKADWFIIET